MGTVLPLDSEPVDLTKPLLEAISVIQKSAYKLALVVDSEKKLVGTVTDGDVRRALLARHEVSESVTVAMNPNPVFLMHGYIGSRLERETRGLSYIPVLDSNSVPIGIHQISPDLEKIENQVILIAGGKGTRLLPHTKDIPKPLVEINGVPIIESLISTLASQGFRRMKVSVGHMAQQIVDRLRDGSHLGVEIEYLHEDQPLGTAGALGALKGKLSKSFIVANADLQTSCDFGSLLRFHESLGGGLTVGMREYIHQIPFGVIEISQTRITGLTEKPRITQLIAAGIYCVSPEVLNYVAQGEPLDMPNLITRLIDSGESQINGFPIHEEWEDVGRPSDLLRLRGHEEK